MCVNEFLPLPFLSEREVKIWKLNNLRYKSRLNKHKHLFGSEATHTRARHNHILGANTLVCLDCEVFGFGVDSATVDVVVAIALRLCIDWMGISQTRSMMTTRVHAVLLLSILSLLDPFQKFIVTCMRHFYQRTNEKKRDSAIPFDTILN